MKKLAIISTHPIQYNAPIFKLLSKRNYIHVKVFYTWENSKDGVFDKKFKQKITWDIPLLEGYEYQFVKNTSADQGTHHRKGIVNPTLIKEIEKWNANAILVFGWNFHSHFKAMRYFKGKVPVLFRGDSTLLNEKPGFKTILRRLSLKFVYKFVDYALDVGINNKNYYLKHGLTEKQLIFAPHAIDNERFSLETNSVIEEVKKWKQELNLAADEIVFLYAGKFEKVKNLGLLIEASQKVKDSGCKFIFAGDGELKKELIEQATGAENIVFLPFQNQSKMPYLYRLADVFVLPSKSETWGLAVNEAMACGKAVLVSDKVGCAVDLVEKGKNGYTFENNNLKSLVSCIAKFKHTNLESYGPNSQIIINEYNYITIVESIEKLINE